MKLPLAGLDAGHTVPARPKTTLGFVGRSEMLALWDQLDEAQQNGLLIAARNMARRNADDEQEGAGPVATLTDPHDLQRGIVEEMARDPLTRKAKR